MLTVSERLRLRVRDLEFWSYVLTKLGVVGKIIDSPFVSADDNLKAIFIHIPKAAGTSVRHALYGTKSFHIPATRYLAADRVRFQRYYKFCFVRNPWDRVCSAFHYLWAARYGDQAYPDDRWASHYLSDIENFAEFVVRLGDDPSFCADVRRYIHFRDQADWVTAPGNRTQLLVDFVGRYERLDEDYRSLESRLGVAMPLPSKRVRQDRQDYRELYDSRMIDIIAQIYSVDIRLFGYEFE